MILKSDRPLPPAARGSQRRRVAIAIAVLAAALSGNALADEYLQPIGGPGGGQFDGHCPSSDLLIGFELRAGDDVDAIRPLCATALGSSDVGAVVETSWHGGTGGARTKIMCPDDKPIVIGMGIGAEGMDTVIVNTIILSCGLAIASQARRSVLVHFDAPRITPSRSDFYFFVLSGDKPTVAGDFQYCRDGQVAVGVHGRSGIWLDAIGLICGEPRVVGHGHVPPPPPPPKKTLAEQRTTTSIAQSSATIAASAGRATSATQASRSAAYGIVSAAQTVPPVGPPVPLPVLFIPPLLEDNAQLWACADAAASEANAGACSGEESAQAYCRLRNAQSGADLVITNAQPVTPVRAVNGDVCPDADACRVVSQLQCDH